MRDLVLVTRPQPDGDRLADRLRGDGYQVLAAPLFAVQLAKAPPPQREYSAVIATSRNALAALSQFGGEALASLPFYAVGAETAEAARETGFKTIVTAAGSAASLARLISEHRPGGELLYLAGVKRKPALEQEAAEKNIPLHVWEAYDMRPLPLHMEAEKALAARQISAVLLFSQQASERFLSVTAPFGLIAQATPDYFCLSPDVAAPLQARGLRAFAPGQSSLDALLALLAKKGLAPARKAP